MAKRHLVINRIATLSIVLVVASILIIPGRADFVIQVTRADVVVEISGDVLQAVPNPSADVTEPFGELPAFSLSLVEENSSSIAIPLSQALRKYSSSADVTHVTFHVASNGTSAHYELDFRVEEVSTLSNGVRKYDLAWKSFAIVDDVHVGGFSINRLVPSYLEEIVELAGPGGGGLSGAQESRWYLNSIPRHPSLISGDVASLTLFNFTSLKAPLEDWAASPHLAGPAIRLKTSSGFNLTFIGRIPDPTDPFAFARNVVYSLNATVEVPWESVVSGSEVSFHSDGGISAPVLMSSLVMVSGMIYISAIILEKRIQHRARPRRGKTN